ncbi:hypothetical protein DJ81_17510 [Halorubrum sp. Hd13]|nr:hypothetical protein DJ81_17510 [Halorubrum sp. Hd13]
MTGTGDPAATGDGDSLPDGGARWRQVVERRHEPERDDGLTTAIVSAIADAGNVSPSSLKSPPLYEVVDAAEIEQAFLGLNAGESARRGTGSVEFRYTEYLVEVGSDWWIRVYERIEAGDPDPNTSPAEEVDDAGGL